MGFNYYRCMLGIVFSNCTCSECCLGDEDHCTREIQHELSHFIDRLEITEETCFKILSRSKTCIAQKLFLRSKYTKVTPEMDYILSKNKKLCVDLLLFTNFGGLI